MRKRLLTILIVFLVIVIVQLVLALRDRAKNKNAYPRHSMLKAAPIFLFVASWGLYFLSWVDIPLTKGINFFQLVSGSGVSSPSFPDRILIAGVMIFFSIGLMASGAFWQLVLKVNVRSIPTLIFEVIVGITSSVIGFMCISKVSHVLDRWDPFSQTEVPIGSLIPVSAGAGLICLSFIGIIYAAFVLIQQRIQVRKLREAAPANGYSDLRELKKLLDEGIITEEEFERKKAGILA
jgi:hypothetical protein